MGLVAGEYRAKAAVESLIVYESTFSAPQSLTNLSLIAFFTSISTGFNTTFHRNGKGYIAVD